MQALKRALRPALQPAAVRYHAARAQMNGIDQRTQVINDQVSVLLQRLLELEVQLRTDARVLGEFSSTTRRVVSKIERRFDDMSEVVAGERLASRVVEAPAVIASLAGIDPPAPVLLVGRDSNGVALALGSLGYAVTALDGGSSVPSHPRLTAVVAPPDQWSGGPEPFAAAVLLSDFARAGGAVEPGDEAGVEARIIGRAHDWVAPGGRLVLTVSYGPQATPGPDRIFDDEQITKILAGWQVTAEQVYLRRGEAVWEPASGGRSSVEWSSSTSGLVLVVATAP